VNDKSLKYEASAGGKDSIYIYNTSKSALQVTGKINLVTIDKAVSLQVFIIIVSLYIHLFAGCGG
jgi:hypothetical protein